MSSIHPKIPHAPTAGGLNTISGMAMHKTRADSELEQRLRCARFTISSLMRLCPIRLGPCRCQFYTLPEHERCDGPQNEHA